MSQYPVPTTASGKPQWEITGVTDSFGPSIGPVPQRYKRVAFTTEQGDSSYVEVPLAPGWTEDAVRLIQQHVDELYALKRITGPVG